MRQAPLTQEQIRAAGLSSRQGGYKGLAGVLAALQGGVNARQFSRLQEGRTGGHGWGKIGGFNGEFSGLSPYATNFLTKLLKPKSPQLQALTRQEDTDGDGVMEDVSLQGDELWRATLMNNLAEQNAAANPQYELGGNVDVEFLGQLLGQGFGGNSAYEKGYGAEGRIAGPGGGSFSPPRRQRPLRPRMNRRHPRRRLM